MGYGARPKAVGHANIQTTINTYVHLTDDDLQQEYQKYLQRVEKWKLIEVMSIL